MPRFEVVLMRAIQERAVVEVEAPSVDRIWENLPDRRSIEWRPTDVIVVGPDMVRIETIKED
jgi:hypothetical protein